MTSREFAPEERYTFDMCMVFKVPEETEDADEKAPKYPAPLIMDKLKNANLITKMYKSVQKDEIYVLIGATEDRLEDEAERIRFELPLDTDTAIEYGCERGVPLAKYTKEKDKYCNLITTSLWKNMYGRFSRDVRILYEQHFQKGTIHDGSVFRPVDRIKLLVSIIEADTKLGGAGLAVGKLMKDKNRHFDALFPLHDEVEKDKLEGYWIRFSNVLNQPLDAIRDYFGEDIALYFAFLEYYNKSLIWVGILGLAFFIYHLVRGSIASSSGTWVYALIVSLWCSMIMEIWKRRESRFRIRWGMSKFEETEQPRPEFKGDWIRSPITGRIEEIYPWYRQLIRKMLSQAVIWTFIAAVIAAVTGVMILRGSWVKKYGTNGKVGAAALNAAQIQLFNWIYSTVSLKLNHFENRRTDSEFRDSLIAKSFIFKFINSYNSFFYLAFFQKFDTPDLRCSYDSTASNNCLTNLRLQLVIVFVVMILLNNFFEIVLPWLMALFSRRSNLKGVADSDIDDILARRSQPEEEYELATYDSTFYDYDELATQFGYVVLFITAFPFTPILAIANNLFEVYVDATKLLKVTRRPEPRGTNDIGTWHTIFLIIGTLAVITNVALTIIAFDEFQTLAINVKDSLNAPDSISFFKLFLFVISEHVILGIKYFIILVIPDVPMDVQEHLARQDYISDVLISGAREDEEDMLPEISMGSNDPVLRKNSFFNIDEIADELVLDEHTTFGVKPEKNNV